MKFELVEPQVTSVMDAFQRKLPHEYLEPDVKEPNLSNAHLGVSSHSGHKITRIPAVSAKGKS